MAILGEGIIRLIADTSGALEGLRGVKRSADNIASSIAKHGRAMSAAVTAPVVGAFTMAVREASDLNEATNKLQVTFGQYGDQVISALGDTVKNFGMARSAAYEAAATYGVFLKAAGLTEQQLAEMSPKLLRVAADMASFHNIGIEEALYKLRAGLSGETEPLKAVGILMNEAMLQAQALKMGLVQAQVDMTKVKGLTLAISEAQKKYNDAVRQYGADSTEAQKALLRVQTLEQKLNAALEGKVPQLTEAQKIQARYGLIMEQSAVFAGDFQRTQGEVANASRVLHQEVRELAASFGTELLPVARDLLREAIALLNAFRNLPEPVKRNIIRFAALAAAIGPLLMGISAVIRIGSGIATVVGWVGKIGSLAGMVQSAGAAIAAALGPVGLAIIAIVAIVGLLYLAWKNNWLGIRDKTAAAAAWLRTALNGIATAVKTFVGKIPLYFQLLVNNVRLKWLALLDTVSAIAERIKAASVQKFGDMINAIRAVFSIDWGALGRNIVSGIIGGISSMAGALVSKLQGLAQSALSAAKSVLGIHSPSREFARLGMYSMLGYLQGVEQMGTRLQQVTQRAFAPPPAQRPAMTGAGGGQGPVTIIVNNPRPEAAEDSIARAMRRLAYLGKR